MGVVADGSPELMPAGSASQAAAGQNSSMRMVVLSLEVRSLAAIALPKWLP